MAKGSNQKLKLFYLARIFYEQTDDNHGISIQTISSFLSQYGIEADRKTLYNDFEELKHFGFDIVSHKVGRTYLYYLASREFELAELKLLVDSVQSSKFITDNKSFELIHKLESMVSIHEAKQLHRQVYLSGRVKAMNESIYYSIDKLHTAINENKQISFQYFQWNVEKKQELRHNGAKYLISPWALVWNNEYYYLIGYDHQQDKIKHFRVDKMVSIDILENKRLGQDIFNRLNLPEYSKTLFGMFGGNEEYVSLECENSLAGVIIDRFGSDISMRKLNDTHFIAKVHVSVSEQFIGWIIGLGSSVKIAGPENVVEKARTITKRLMEQYLS